jgi:raffinose/stachyose/melibiose transport system permease protein
MNRLLNGQFMTIRKPIHLGITSLAAIGIAAITIFPLYLVVITSFKEQGRVVLQPLRLPEVWHWENIVLAWQKGHFSTYFLNSILVTIPTVLIILTFSLLAAYVLARKSFPGKNLLFVIFLTGLAIPGDVLIIPLYYDLKDMGLLNTRWALILPSAAFGLSFGILLLRSFIEVLPKEILEAAIIDGCSDWELLVHIVAYLCRPALLSLMIFNFMWTWNQFLFPIVLIQKDSLRTLPVGLNYFQGRYVTNVPLLMAGATIVFLPVVILYIIFQRDFIKGITTGALKS